MINHTNFKGKLSTDVLEKIVMVQGANEFPLYAALLGAGKKLTAKAERVSWWVSKHISRRGQINNAGAAYDAATAMIVVDDASIYSPGDILLSEATGETLFVVSVNTGSNNIAINRSTGTVAASAQSVADNVYLLNIGNAHGEGASSPAHRSGDKHEVYNLVQTIRRAVEMSGRLGRIETDTEDERAFQRVDAFSVAIRDIEHGFMFGSRNGALVDSDGKRVTTMGGLQEAVVSHVDNIAGVLTQPLFDAFAEMAFSTGSRVKTLYAGPTLLTAINALYRGQVRISIPQANVGLRVNQITTAHGDLNLIPHNGLKGAYAGDGIVVDQDQLLIRPTKGGELALREDTQAKGDDASRDEVFAELTLQYGAEENHARITGVTAA